MRTRSMTSAKSDSSFLEGVNRVVDRAVGLLDLDDGLAEHIKACNATYQVRFPVRMRGSYRVFTGWYQAALAILVVVGVHLLKSHPD